MKKYLFAAASAVLLSALITELHFRLFSDQYFALFLLTALAIFIASIATTVVESRFDHTASTPARARARARQDRPQRRDASPRAGAPRERGNNRQPQPQRGNGADGDDAVENYGEPEDATADRETGTVKWFNRSKGYGFISRDGGGEIFVHYKAIRGSGRRSLRDGQRVSFAVVGHDKGLQADKVSSVRGDGAQRQQSAQ